MWPFTAQGYKPVNRTLEKKTDDPDALFEESDEKRESRCNLKRNPNKLTIAFASLLVLVIANIALLIYLSLNFRSFSDSQTDKSPYQRHDRNRLLKETSSYC